MLIFGGAYFRNFTVFIVSLPGGNLVLFGSLDALCSTFISESMK